MEYISDVETNVDIAQWADQIRQMKVRELKDSINRQREVAYKSGQVCDQLKLHDLWHRLEFIQ